MPTITRESPPVSEPSEPYPPRYWWLKRLTVAWLLFIGGMFGVRLWWGSDADWQRARLISEARARGEPVLVADFASPEVPTAQNAALDLKSALSSLYWTQAQEDWENTADAGRLPLSAETVTILGEMEEANRPVLLLVHQAQAKHSVDWGMSPAGYSSSSGSYLNALRKLANTERYVGLLEHQQGNDTTWLERLGDIHFVASTMNRGPASCINRLVAIGIDDLACEGIEQTGAELRIGPAAGETRTAVQSLIVEAVG